MIERGDLGDTKPLGRSYHRRVGSSEGKVAIRSDKLCNSQPVTRNDWFGDEIALCKVCEESDLGFDPQAGTQQVRHFRNDERRHEQRTGMCFEKFETFLVMTVVSIDVGEERPGIDDQRDEPNSAARISSMRSEMSERPLDPAPAARRRLRPAVRPRCASMASLVISEIVVPRRCAS